MRRHSLALVLLLGLAVVLAGCGAATDDEAAIEETIYAFAEAYNARDYQKCLSYLTGWDDSSTEEAQLSLLEMARGFTGQMTVAEIEEISVTGSTATAVVTSSWEYPDEEGKTTNAPGEEVTLRKDGGVWKYVV
jgi:ketosteroid isomerase-like protein